GSELTIVGGLEKADRADKIGASYEDVASDVAPGERVLLDDGLIELAVLSTDPPRREVRCRVVYGGVLKERKGMNFPETRLRVPSVTPKDREDLAWGLEHDVDFVALSFVRHEDDLLEVKEVIRRAKAPPRLVTKVEKPQAVARMGEICEASDGI